MRISLIARLLLVLTALMVTPGFSFTILDAFDGAVPKDEGTVKVASDIAYAPGERHGLDIYAPAELTEPAPVMMFIYGGGWNRGDRVEYEFVGHAFAARGFVTVIADYRVVPEVRFPGFIEDGAAALKWIEANISKYGGDPGRVYLSGHSAGAYNAVMLALEPSFLRDIGAKITIKGVAGISGPYSFYPFIVDQAKAAFGNAPNPEGTQPVNLVTAEAPPMFLATGTADLIVRPSNTTLLAEKLHAFRIPVETRFYQGLGHMEPVIALSTLARERAPVLDQITAFFADQGAFDPSTGKPPPLSP